MQSEPMCSLTGMAVGITLARSRLFRCSWNADGLFSAATGKREEQSAQEWKQAATRIFSNSILMSAIKIATQLAALFIALTKNNSGRLWEIPCSPPGHSKRAGGRGAQGVKEGHGQGDVQALGCAA